MPKKETKKSKKYILDTSVILDDPYNIVALSQNGENTLFISDIILKELDGHKEDIINQKGVFAREFIRSLEQVEGHENKTIKRHKRTDFLYEFKSSLEGIEKPISIIGINRKEYDPENKTNDLKILEIAQAYELDVVTNDANLKLIGLSQGTHCSSLRKDMVKKPEEIDFKIEIRTKLSDKENALKEAALKCKNFFQVTVHILDEDGYETGEKEYYLAEPTGETTIVPYQNYTFIDFEKDSNYKKEIRSTKSTINASLKEIENSLKDKSVICVSLITEDGKGTGEKEFFKVESLRKVKLVKQNMEDKDFEDYPIKPANIEQKFLLKILSNSKTECSIVTGSTGSGKTLMTLQEGLRRVQDPDDYIEKIVYLRNTVTANDKASELGFRKGDQNQKLGYFAQPLFGNINLIMETLSNKKTSKRFSFSKSSDKKEESSSNSFLKQDATENFMKENHIEVIDIAHARGISLNNSFVIFDENQNCSNATTQLIGTRMGSNSILVIMGDYRQVDHPYLSKNRNSLVTLLKQGADPKGFDSDYFAAIQLRKTIRSEMANWFQNKFNS